MKTWVSVILAALSLGWGAQASAQAEGNVYKTLAARCRVADSRAPGIGAMPGGGQRTLHVLGAGGSYAAQGGTGDPSTCNMPSDAAAYAISVTALPLGSAGYLKVFPAEKLPSDGNTVSFAGSGTATNDMIVKSGALGAAELAVFASANTHYIVDIVGYFRAPKLECGQGPNAFRAINPGAVDWIDLPNCQTGYVQTGTWCIGLSTWNIQLLGVWDYACSGRNVGNSAATLQGARTCCRLQ